MGQSHAPAASTPGKDTVYQLCRGLGGPQGRSGRAEKSRPHRDSIPDRPAPSHLLYRLSYPAHNLLMKLAKCTLKKSTAALCHRRDESHILSKAVVESQSV